MCNDLLKTNQLRWEVPLFVMANVLEIFGQYIYVFFITVFIFLLYIAAAGGLFFLAGIALIALTFICLVLFLVANKLLIFFIFNFIEQKGNKKYKLKIKHLKNDKLIKIKIVWTALIFDILYVATITLIGLLSDKFNDTFVNKFIFYLKEYFIGGSLSLSYLIAFALFGIGDWVKKIRCKNVG